MGERDEEVVVGALWMKNSYFYHHVKHPTARETVLMTFPPLFGINVTRCLISCARSVDF